LVKTYGDFTRFFERVKKANLCLRPSKCKIGFDQVKFLGHTLQGDCIKRQDESVGRILNTERPNTKKSCSSLLGMINFYRRYIPNCAEVIAALTELTKNRAPNNVEWGAEQEKAFKEVKKILSSEPILKLPDLNRDIILSTDASNKSLGTRMIQEYDGVKHPVMYASKKDVVKKDVVS